MSGIKPSDKIETTVWEMEHNYVSRQAYEALAAENDSAKAEIVQLRVRLAKIDCVYCGASWQIGTEPLNHWEQCERHPARAQLTAAQSENETLRGALQPFADYARIWEPNDALQILLRSRWGLNDNALPDLKITVGDLLKAAAALKDKP